MTQAPIKPIQLFVPTFRIDETLEEIRQCLEKGWTGLGFKTVDFEKAFCHYAQMPYGHFLNSATSGLHLAVAQLKTAHGWEDGDEIITTPLTFVSSNHAILYENLRPIFADVDEFLCLNPLSVAARITPRTRAVMYVGMGGNVGRYEALRDLCRSRGLKLILDASHMVGTRLNDRHIGHDADVTIFSFQAVKNLPTGDSGMICWPDAEMDALTRRLSWLGINKDTYARTGTGGTYKWYYDVEDVGFKYHGNSIMAAMALVSLNYVDEDNAFRRQLCARYDQLLAGAEGIAPVPMAPHCEPSRHLYQVLVEKRDAVMAIMNEQGVFPGVHYRDNTVYDMYAYAAGTCPEAEIASNRLLSLPLHLRLTEDDIARVVQVLKEAVAKVA
jgi:dTDP-4-amino-4,6-dideoxygalactose transaminase